MIRGHLQYYFMVPFRSTDYIYNYGAPLINLLFKEVRYEEFW